MNNRGVSLKVGKNYGVNQLEFRKSLVYFAFGNIKGRLLYFFVDAMGETDLVQNSFSYGIDICDRP